MVAKELDVHVSEITGLMPLDFVERDDGNREKGELSKMEFTTIENASCI